jgi:hypothetical protein
MCELYKDNYFLTRKELKVIDTFKKLSFKLNVLRLACRWLL